MKSNISPFKKEGNWYKGNTHTHTNVFDGFSPAEDVINLYKNEGYNFLAITDHNLFNVYPQYNDDNFIMLNGTELTYGVEIKDEGLLKQMNKKVANGEMSQSEMLSTIATFMPIDINKTRVPHVIAISRDPEMVDWTGIDSKNFSDIQVMLDLAKEHNCISIIAHPTWSKLTIKDLEPLKDYTAIEVYNHVCETYFAGGDASIIWDELLNANIPTNFIACDDTHDISISLGGYIMVKAENLDYHSIITAIEDGDYYSTCGPIIHDVTLVDGVVNISCSKANNVRFIPDIPFGRTYRDADSNIEHCSHKLEGSEKHIRIEVTDSDGRKAWTNPIYL